LRRAANCAADRDRRIGYLAKQRVRRSNGGFDLIKAARVICITQVGGQAV
jgi:hypothetical protein